MSKEKVALLSFDVEEFDLPMEHGFEITEDDSVGISRDGLIKVLKVLKKHGVKATFFCTLAFASQNDKLLRKMEKDGHEIASHGVNHTYPAETDLEESKECLEWHIESEIVGFRQPRMQPVNYKKMKKLGYVYDSSVNPAFIPGRYNHLNTPRKPYKKNGIVEIPVSVATIFRIPLFWLSLHLFPEWLYFLLVKMSLKKTGYFATYFHPWEFAEIYRLTNAVPWYIRKNSGDKLERRLNNLVKHLKKSGVKFKTYADYAKIV